MAIIFKEDGHSYESIEEDNIQWLSVTSLVSKFKPKFDKEGQAKKSAKNKNSKWYGMTVEQIIEAWDNETNRAINLGNFYHNQRESDMLDFKTIERNGTEIPIIKPLVNNDGIKLAPEQKLSDGLYPEHLVYLKSVGICGQADVVEIIDGFINWEGITSKMYKPINHLDDCNLNHYSLQLSIYAYIIKKHNPSLKIGRLTIQHVKFKQIGEDANGYPINEHYNGEPILDEIKMYEVPYLKDEVNSLIMWLKDNK